MTRAYFERKQVPVSKLLLDLSNARIRKGLNQEDCIRKILKKEDQTMKLLRDIAENGLSTMPVLIAPHGNKWVVWDGNRRVACLKLLNKPALCADPVIRKKVESIRKKHKDNIPTSIECLWTDDRDILIKEVIKRHSGALGGAGQLDWSSYLRTLFLLGHEQPAEYKRAGQYLFWAENNELDVDDEFPISTLSRFLNKKNLLLLGFDIINDEITPIYSLTKTKEMTKKVINDLESKIIKVDDVRTDKKAEEYIDRVRAKCDVTEPAIPITTPVDNTQDDEEDEAPPSSLDDMEGDQTESDDEPSKAKGKTIRRRNGGRPKLFTPAKSGLNIPDNEKKVRDIVFELARLKHSGRDGTPISVAFLLRALIELSTNNYLKNNPSAVKKGDTTLRVMIKHAATHMKENGLITQERLEVVLRHCNQDGDILNITTLQKYLHSDVHFPSGETLNSIWDEIGEYVCNCW